MSLSSEYQRALAENGYREDPAQRRAIGVLERVRGDLVTRQASSGPLAGLRRRLFGGSNAPPLGAYLWGGVGRGKTFAMDLFFDSLPFEDKLRAHFHRLMYRVHRRLGDTEQRKDPLDAVAEELAAQARVICFDEFFVSDIGDAMILGRLLRGLFERQVCLVATSNIPPQQLYADGLQRQKFVPAIELLETHTEVVEVEGVLLTAGRVVELGGERAIAGGRHAHVDMGRAPRVGDGTNRAEMVTTLPGRRGRAVALEVCIRHSRCSRMVVHATVVALPDLHPRSREAPTPGIQHLTVEVDRPTGSRRHCARSRGTHGRGDAQQIVIDIGRRLDRIERPLRIAWRDG